MTLTAKMGAENVLRALMHYISGNSPAAIAAFNATTSATLQAYTKGPYTYDGSKVISITRNNAASPITYTPDAGTYTATELAALLNADETFNASLTAAAVQQGNYLQIYETTRGTAGSLKAEDTTGNAVLGWGASFVDNYYPLRDFAEIGIQWDNVDPVAYPALLLRCDSVDMAEGYPDTIEYDIAIRMFEVAQGAPADPQFYIQLTRMARVIRELLAPSEGSRSLDGQVVSLDLNSYTPAREFLGDGTQHRASVEFSLTVQVRED